MSGSVCSSDSWQSIGTNEFGIQPEGQQQERTEKDQQDEATFVIDFPKDLNFPQHGEERVPELQEQASTASSAVLVNQVGKLTLKSGNCSSLGSVASTSSFVAVPNAAVDNRWTALRSRKDDDTSSYSDVASAVNSVTTYGTSAVALSVAASGASSVISNFDILSLSGRVVRRCKRCSYHNSENATTCATCYLALVANPSLDIDLQIAMNLEKKEEEEAFQKLQRDAKKRKSLSSATLYQRAEAFVEDVVSAVTGLPKDIKTLHEGSFVLLASKFIDVLIAQNGRHKVSLAYLFTQSDANPLNGFGDMVEVSHNANTALGLFHEPGMVRRGGSLFSIPEHCHPLVPEVHRSIGWIVAIVESPSIEVSEWVIHPPIGSGLLVNEYAKKIPEAAQILPLVSFPTTERNSSNIQHRAHGLLKRVCDDHFLADLPEPESDEGLAKAIAASLQDKPQKKARVQQSAENEDASKNVQKDYGTALSQAILSSEQEFVFRGANTERTQEAPDALSVLLENAFKSDDIDWGHQADTFLDAFEPITFGFDRCVDSKEELQALPNKQCAGENDDDTRFPVYNANDAMVGKRVQILGGCFEGHIGRVTEADSSHFWVVVETIRSHKPSVMVSRNRAREVGAAPDTAASL